MQIKRLEDCVGAQLFDRSVRPPLLTPVGEALLPYARDMLSINDAAMGAIRRKHIAGQVRLAMMEDYASIRLAPLLARFSDENPDVQLEVHTGLTVQLAERLGSDFDLVLTMLPAGSDDGELLYRGKSVWVGCDSTDLANVDPLPLAVYPQGCFFRRWATTALDKAGRNWRTSLVSSSLSAVAAAVREGSGISIFKDNAVPEGVRRLGVDDGLPELPDFEIHLLSAPRAITGAAGELANYIRQHSWNGELVCQAGERDLEVAVKKPAV